MTVTQELELSSEGTRGADDTCRKESKRERDGRTDEESKEVVDVLEASLYNQRSEDVEESSSKNTEQ